MKNNVFIEERIIKFWYFNSDILITENKINKMNKILCTFSKFNED